MLAPQEMESVFLRPAKIASRRFTRTTGGYDPNEVHQFLEDVADYLSRLEGELEWRRARRTRQMGTIGEQEEAISVVTAAREQAERIVAEARKDAEGYVRLARAIAQQLALEAQTRRPHVALAVTRASGSSTTVEGSQDLDDLEVWIDASVFDLTKVEESESPQDVEIPHETPEASDSTNDAASDAAKPPEVLTTTTNETTATEEASAPVGVAASDQEASAPAGGAASDHPAVSHSKSSKKKKKSKKKS
jgi:DivIVA domain-containing protein